MIINVRGAPGSLYQRVVTRIIDMANERWLLVNETGNIIGYQLRFPDTERDIRVLGNYETAEPHRGAGDFTQEQVAATALYWDDYFDVIFAGDEITYSTEYWWNFAREIKRPMQFVFVDRSYFACFYEHTLTETKFMWKWGSHQRIIEAFKRQQDLNQVYLKPFSADAHILDILETTNSAYLYTYQWPNNHHPRTVKRTARNRIRKVLGLPLGKDGAVPQPWLPSLVNVRKPRPINGHNHTQNVGVTRSTVVLDHGTPCDPSTANRTLTTPVD